MDGRLSVAYIEAWNGSPVFRSAMMGLIWSGQRKTSVQFQLLCAAKNNKQRGSDPASDGGGANLKDVRLQPTVKVATDLVFGY
jgi:hypothetical protein